MSDPVARSNLDRSADPPLPSKWNPISPTGASEALTSSNPARKEAGNAIPYAATSKIRTRPSPLFGLIVEELHQYGSMRLGLQHMRLPLERLAPRVRQCARERPVSAMHPFRAFLTVHDECRYRHGCPPVGLQRLASLVVSYYRAVIKQGMRNGFELRPHRHQRHQHDKKAGRPTDFRKSLTASPRRFAATAPPILAQSRSVVERLSSTMNGASYNASFLIPFRRFGRLKRKNCARGNAPEKCRTARFAH